MFVSTFVYFLVHPLPRSLVRLLVHSFVRSIFSSFVYWFDRSLVRAFVHLFVRSFVRSPVHFRVHCTSSYKTKSDINYAGTMWQSTSNYNYQQSMYDYKLDVIHIQLSPDCFR